MFITAPNPASGAIPEDVAGTFEGPYFEWFSTEKAKVTVAGVSWVQATWQLKQAGGTGPEALFPLCVCVLPLLTGSLLAAQDGQELVFTYHNMLKSEATIMHAIRELGPFDGICGFSQVREKSRCWW